MSTKRNSEICSVPFCTADLSRYQCEYYHSKTKLKVCLPCSRFYWKYKRDRSEAQMSDKCSRCKVRNKNYNCSVTQQPLCRCSVPFCTVDLSQYQCNFYHPKTMLKVCRPCSLFFNKHTRDRTEAQLSDTCSKCKVKTKRQYCSITQLPLYFTDHSFSSPDGNGASDLVMEDETKTPEDAFDHSDFYVHSSHDHVSGSNKNRYTAIGNQEENYDIIATDVSNCFTNANLLPEIEISDHRLKSNSEICSVPFCTVDLSQYQRKFYHPETEVRVCRPCCRFFNKHKRDRTEAQMSDKCSKCKIKKKTIHCSITQQPLCKQNFKPDTNIPVLIDEPSKNHEKIGSGSRFAAPQLVSDVCEAPIQRPRNTLFKKEKPIRRMRQIHDDEDIDSD
ncbi:hypothetical protein GCK72_021544 [Caenorhabditis remanei]|uniref:Uncharacterized protein n=1 Tax=Caenorhabditis remanei TaxID=31234 RepID=A0A6A5GIG2_CAERE|nr:hypothetical protein GCK72_021544 [Caenorhabditis remanei]KAF1754978.1 hypothetical protein GCK72_021544 [Caenorhabditis remanei]